MAAPTFVAEYETVWNTATSPKTSSVTVATGDYLVVVGLTADSTTQLSTPTGGGLTYTLQASVVNVSSKCSAYIWTAPCGSSQTFTLSVTRTGGTSPLWGFNCLRFSGATAVGVATSTNGSGAPTLNVTAQAANSALIVGNADWNAADGASRTWRTNAGSLTEQSYFRNATDYAAYVGFHPDAGTATTDAVGLSAPAGQAYAIVAVELKGATGTTASATDAPVTVAAQDAALSVAAPGPEAAATVTGADPTPALSTLPSDGPASVTAHDVAGVSATTVIGEAPVSVGGVDASVLVNPPLADAGTTISAADGSAKVGPEAAEASGAVVGADVTSTVSIPVDVGVVTVGAPDATVTTPGATNAPADTADVALSALDSAPAVTGNPIDATVGIAAADHQISVLATAADALATVAGADTTKLANASPIDASTAVTGADASAGINPAPADAPFAVAALDATVSVSGATTVPATDAPGTVSAFDASVTTSVSAEYAVIAAAADVITGAITTLVNEAAVSLAALDSAVSQHGGSMEYVERAAPGMSFVDGAAPGMTPMDRMPSTMTGA